MTTLAKFSPDAPRRRALHAGVLVVLFAICAVTLSCSGDTPVDSSDDAVKKNVLLIVVDTLRADRLSLYGHDRPTSPNIDAIARHGVVFERAFSHAPWTGPTMASLFTGTHQSVHQLSMIPAGSRDFSVLDESFVTMAELLSAAGYETTAISAQPWVAEETGFAQGFGAFHVVGTTSQKYEAEKIALGAIDTLKSSDSPFFMYLHFMTPHTPYDPPPPFSQLEWVLEPTEKLAPFVGKPHGEVYEFMTKELAGEGPNRATQDDLDYLLSLYDAEIAHVDHWIGVVHRELERRGLLEETIVVLVADHGESFMEHGQLGHDYQLYNELLRIPLVVANPSLFPDGSENDEIAGVIDLLPTLSGLLGLGGDPQFQGRDLLNDPPSKVHYAERRFHERNGPVATREKIQTAEWSLIFDPVTDRYELYDLLADPGEQNDLYGSESEVEKRLMDLLDGARAANLSHPSRVDSKTTPMDDAMIERLQSLGYLN